MSGKKRFVQTLHTVFPNVLLEVFFASCISNTCKHCFGASPDPNALDVATTAFTEFSQYSVPFLTYT